MKKLTALLLILTLCLSLCACGKSAAGTWMLTGFVYDGKDWAQYIQDNGVVVKLQLNEDGTGYLDYGDRQEDLTWDREGLNMDGIKRLYTIRHTLRGDTLTIGYNDQRMTFTRR